MQYCLASIHQTTHYSGQAAYIKGTNKDDNNGEIQVIHRVVCAAMLCQNRGISTPLVWVLFKTIILL